MAMQKFTGTVIGIEALKTKNKETPVVHVLVDFMPEIKINGKLPEIGENTMTRIQLSFWDEKFQQAILSEGESLKNKMVTGYCDHVTQREQYYNGTGYAFVLDPKGKPKAPELQVISSSAPTAPAVPV